MTMPAPPGYALVPIARTRQIDQVLEQPDWQWADILHAAASMLPDAGVASAPITNPTGRVHELKIWPAQFEAVASGRKTFEFRLNDRDFQEGDVLILNRFDAAEQQFTGESLSVLVTYVLKDRFGVPEGYAVLGIVQHAPQSEDLPSEDVSPAVRLAELVLSMDMATEKGRRARDLARQVLSAPELRSGKTDAETRELANLRDRWDRVIRAAEKVHGPEAMRFKLSLRKNGTASNCFPKWLDGRWVSFVFAENDAHIGYIARAVEMVNDCADQAGQGQGDCGAADHVAQTSKLVPEQADAASAQCWCQTCRPITIEDMRMVVCPVCGNKRCPHANDHRNACTGSNEPGQPGSAYPAAHGLDVGQDQAQ